MALRVLKAWNIKCATGERAVQPCVQRHEAREGETDLVASPLKPRRLTGALNGEIHALDWEVRRLSNQDRIWDSSNEQGFSLKSAPEKVFGSYLR